MRVLAVVQESSPIRPRNHQESSSSGGLAGSRPGIFLARGGRVLSREETMEFWKSVLIGIWLLGLGIPGASARPVTEGPSGGAAPMEEVRRSGAEAGHDRIAVNRADAEQLMRLPGIGPKKAQALIEARERRPFRRPSDLRRVKGFGTKTILRLAPHLSFD